MRPLLPAALLLPLIGALAAPPAQAAEEALALILKDHHFDPAEPSIPANTRVRVTVKNMDLTPAEFESDDFKAEKVVPAGQEASFFIGPLKPGTYEFHDEYAEDASKTHLVVK